MDTPNYDIESDLQEKFWGSRHKLNRAKAIICFSLTEDNANDNLRRYGYTNSFRKWLLRNYKQYVNNYKFNNVPFSPITDPDEGWWNELTIP